MLSHIHVFLQRAASPSPSLLLYMPHGPLLNVLLSMVSLGTQFWVFLRLVFRMKLLFLAVQLHPDLVQAPSDSNLRSFCFLVLGLKLSYLLLTTPHNQPIPTHSSFLLKVLASLYQQHKTNPIEPLNPLIEQP